MRTEPFLIEHEVSCSNCGVLYTPSEVEYVKELDVPPILVNNFCSRKCYDAMCTYLETQKQSKVIND